MSKWFKPKRHSGFSKEKTVDANVRTMIRNADKRLSKDKKLLRVGRQATALANVTTDAATKKKAQAVADRVFRKLK